MKEHPILFSGPLVQAILAGTKTQTRRPVKPQPEDDTEIAEWLDDNGHADDFICPFGVVGDRLWVRETFLPCASAVLYRADVGAVEAAGIGGMYGGWKPSIHMKRQQSRITLEVTAVRCERVQGITEADAIAEGVDAVSVADVPRQAAWSHRQDFSRLWDAIYGKARWRKPRLDWASNPWVWVTEFRRAEE